MKTKHWQTAILLAVAFAADAAAAEYPARLIRFIVPYGGGSGPDITARLFATELSKQIGQQIVVDNRPGASGSIGTEMIARAAPDGYTIGFGGISTFAINPSVLARLPYDPDKDLLKVVQTYFNPGVTGLKRSPAIPELPAIAETVPGFEVIVWGGVVLPAGAPKAIVARLNAEINKVLALPALKEKYATIGYELAGGTPGQFDAFVKSEIAKWAEVVRRSGAKLK